MRPTRSGSLIHLVIFLSSLLPGASARPVDIDVATLVASCRHARDTIQLRPDNNVLCFDGRVDPNAPLDEVRKLNSGGIFVARSGGGNILVAMLIADILLEKNATVILHDYCFSACANAFLVATHETHVARGTVVAWHGGAPNWACAATADSTKQYDPPTNVTIEHYRMYCRHKETVLTFYQRRGITDDFVQRPQTLHSRKMFALLLREGYDKRQTLWMWHPENFGSHFKSKITFQSFPDSQEEVNERLRRLKFPIPFRVVYDPPDMSMLRGPVR